MRFRLWLPPLLWTAVILLASSDLFSAENSGGVLDSVLGRFVPAAWLESIHFAIRKGAHLVVYAILAALVFRAARVDFRHPVVVALAIALCVAVVDEWRQSRSPARTGSVADVVLDLTGAALATAILATRRRGDSPYPQS